MAAESDVIDQSAPPKRGRRRWISAGLIVAIVLGLLVIADRAAALYADNQFADQVKSQGFGAKPTVTIEGFPFLTQAIKLDFNTVKMTAKNVPEGPVVISTIDATAHNLKVNSDLSSGTVGSVQGTGLITFAGLAAANSQPSLDLSYLSPTMVKATIDLGPLSGTATAKVTQVGNTIQVRTVQVEGLPLSQVGSMLNFTVKIPALPLGMKLDHVRVSPQGLLLTITGTNLHFKK